jgi:hypothetical protein
VYLQHAEVNGSPAGGVTLEFVEGWEAAVGLSVSMSEEEKWLLTERAFQKGSEWLNNATMVIRQCVTEIEARKALSMMETV